MMHIITYRQSAFSLVLKRISSEQRRHVKPLVEAVVAVAREANARMTVASGSMTRTNQMEGMIMETVKKIKWCSKEVK